jgi:hypothetical protein
MRTGRHGYGMVVVVCVCAPDLDGNVPTRLRKSGPVGNSGVAKESSASSLQVGRRRREHELVLVGCCWSCFAMPWADTIWRLRPATGWAIRVIFALCPWLHLWLLPSNGIRRR